MRVRRRRAASAPPRLDLGALGVTPAQERYPCTDGEPHVFNVDEGDTNLGVSWQRCRCGGIIMTERGAT